ncbi:MAG TPA: GGDEF domain-containing protein [Blastocatellia bacterium]
MTEAITNDLHQEIERILGAFGASPDFDKEVETIFREGAAIRLKANDVIRRNAERVSKEELIELQSILSAKLDDLLSARIGRLLEHRALAWAEQSECDPVTTLPNRAAFNRRLRGEIERARRYCRELSIVLFDIDRFKEINDRFGHPEGDRRLAEVASLLKSSLRQSDAVFRYGGDEFAAICPETSGAAMAQALRRLESKMSGVSWGMASFPAEAAEEDDLIRVADDRLYACKRSRRRARRSHSG